MKFLLYSTRMGSYLILTVGLLWASTLLPIHVDASAIHDRNASSRRCLPGDVCWPTAQEWAQLNATVEGRLIATVPLGAPCHDPQYNEMQCAALRNDWVLPQTQ